MLDQKIRVFWDRAMRPVGRLVGAVGFSPNVLTVIGVAVQAAAAYLIVEGRLLVAGFV